MKEMKGMATIVEMRCVINIALTYEYRVQSFFRSDVHFAYHHWLDNMTRTCENHPDLILIYMATPPFPPA